MSGETSSPTFSPITILFYPCDAGTGWPMGYHQYVRNNYGSCCSLCGHVPTAVDGGDTR